MKLPISHSQFRRSYTTYYTPKSKIINQAKFVCDQTRMKTVASSKITLIGNCLLHQIMQTVV